MPKSDASSRSHETHGKHPKLEELEGQVRSGEIDTLVVAITDMQGRLVGKRVQAEAFLNGVIDHGAHFCTYLLGTDMEMGTPEGFALMNWETGYGDWVAEPVWDTLRVLPWLEKTALVLADATDGETGDEIPVSPRTILKRQVERAADDGHHRQVRLGARVLRAQGLVGEPRRAGLATAQAVRLLQRGLPAAPGDQGRAAAPAAAQPDDGGPDPDRVQQGRGGERPARGQHPLRPRARVGRPDGDLQARRQGDRLPQRLGHHVHGQARPPLDRLVGPPPHEHLGSRRRPAADARGQGRARGALRPLDAGLPVRGRDDGAVARARRVHRAVHQQLQALRRALVGPRQRRLGPRQPDDRLPARRQRRHAPRREPLSRAAT